MVTVDDVYMPLTLTPPGTTNEQFEQLSAKYEDYRVEYTAEGDLLVMSPTDPETRSRNLQIAAQLMMWAMNNNKDGLGTESSGGFTLPNGARLSRDAS